MKTKVTFLLNNKYYHNPASYFSDKSLVLTCDVTYYYKYKTST